MQSRRVVVAENLLWVLWREHVDSVSRPRTGVRFPRSGKPPNGAKEANEACHADSVVHVVRLHRPHRWEEEHNANEDDPCHRNCIDRFAPSAHGVWTRVELDLSFVPSVCNNDGDVAYIQGWRGDVENSRNGQRAADTDQIEAAAEGYDEPDSIDRCVREAIDLAPEPVSCQPSSRRRSSGTKTHPEKGKAASRENAQAIRAFASIAEQPVKNCTSITKNHMMVPPVLPPALKKICATGRPVGVAMIAS